MPPQIAIQCPKCYYRSFTELPDAVRFVQCGACGEYGSLPDGLYGELAAATRKLEELRRRYHSIRRAGDRSR
jgi:hypothetical protein